MASERSERGNLKERAKEEALEFFAISLYLAIFLGALLNYRRIVLADVGLSYAHYGFAVVEALVLGKIVLIGDALHLGTGAANRPLIIAAIYKSLWFGAFVLAFLVLEETVHGLLTGRSLRAEVEAVLARPAAMLAHVFLVIMAFIPFFMLREAGSQLGQRRLVRLMFRRPDPAAPPPDIDTASRSAPGAEPHRDTRVPGA